MRTFSLLFVSSVIWAEVPAGKIDAAVEAARKAFDVPGISVAIVEGDSTIYAKGFGVKKLGSKEAVTAKTRFAIGSTTKAFTTAAMGVLVDDGKMQWDDPVRKHVPFFRLSDPLASENVTMRDIVSHRTGLSRHDMLWYGSPWDREDIIHRIGMVPLTRSYRSTYQYQNIMFLTAGHAVGLISKTSWEDFVRTRILNPLDMGNTDFSTKDVINAPDYAIAHNKVDNSVREIPWRNIDNIAPAGSINSSVDDLAHWVSLHLNSGSYKGKRILKEATVREMHSPQTVIRTDDPTQRAINEETNLSAYGLGWVVQDYRGRLMVSHGGAIDGFRAQVTLLPKQRYGIVILANLGGNNMPEALRSTIADVLLNAASKDWNALYLEQASKAREQARKRIEERNAKRFKDTKPSRELAAYAGEYTHPAYGSVTVKAANGGLTVEWSNWKPKLEHFHFDVFRAVNPRLPLDDELVEFRLDAKGEPDSVHLFEQQFRRKRS